jgi:hypothetical protein
MSWSKTVRCSYCYESGHNRRTCSAITAIYHRRYKHFVRSVETSAIEGQHDAVEEAQRNADLYRTEYIKRTGCCPDTGEKVKREMKVKSMICGYCREQGHTRRTCKTVLHDKSVFVEASRSVRQKAYANLVEFGFGVGSIVPLITSWKDPQIMYIKRISWNRTNANHPILFAVTVPFNKISAANAWDEERYSISRINDVLTNERHKALPRSLTSVVDKPPVGWLACEDMDAASLKKVFPSKGNKSVIIRNWSFKYPDGAFKEAIAALGLQDHYDMDY